MSNAPAPTPAAPTNQAATNEAALVAQYCVIDAQLHGLVKALEAHFMGLAKTAETAEDFEDLIRRCPDDLIRCFLMDAKRQYLGRLEEAARAAELAGELEVR